MKRMELVLKPFQPFDLDLTLCCGQAFRWEKIGDWWYGIVKGKPLKVRQKGNLLEFENTSQKFIENYFRLGDDLQTILTQIAKDKHMEKAVKTLKGLRVLRQDPWECLIAYICATYKNIPAIKQMLFNIAKNFGEKTVLDGYTFYTFPTAEKLAKANLKELAECGLGYRAKYVSETAKKVANGEVEIESLKEKSYEKVRETLLTLRGVGLKVADCVSLFALEKLEAFPVDVWIKRAILKHYANHFEKEFIGKISLKKSLTKADYERLSLFGRNYFGVYAGYAQEYLFHFERTMANQP
ncbi:8-oxoguanine DNA glycosylase [Candidatus Bathyarchaeota archaeon]|nr:MAG: 8-oxoguanine DNA glycosylase [Candidatus Bathyarchaeota archaeon]